MFLSLVLGILVVKILFIGLKMYVLPDTAGTVERFLRKPQVQKRLQRSATLFLLISFLLGSWQVAQFYLLSGAYLWLLILSFGAYGLVFIEPFYAVSLPNIKTKTIGRFSRFLYYLALFLTFVWLYLLFQQKASFVYTDEGGVGTRAVNLGWKKLTEGLLLINLVIQLAYQTRFENFSKRKKMQE